MSELFVNPPSNQLRNFAGRMGTILTNLAFVALLLCTSAVLTFLSVVLVWVVALTILLATLGTIFVIAPSFFDNVTAATQNIADFSTFLLQYFDALAIFSVVAAAVALVLLNLDRRKKRIGRVVFASFLLACGLFALLLSSVGVLPT